MPILEEKSPLRTMNKQVLIEYTACKNQQYQRNPHKKYRSNLLYKFYQTTQFKRKYAQKLLSKKRRRAHERISQRGIRRPNLQGTWVQLQHRPYRQRRAREKPYDPLKKAICVVLKSVTTMNPLF